jgi:hypothetical protein
MKSINPNIKVLSEYVNAKTKVTVQCLACNHIYKVTPDKLHSGRGCPACAQRSRAKKRSKSVVNVDTGEKYESIRIATRSTGINNIGTCCRGKLETAGGYRWEFIQQVKEKYE